jgi:uncharacterized membrane protein
MSRQKQHDEIYCRSCGEPIKKKAEICVNCGVSNDHGETKRSTQTQTDSFPNILSDLLKKILQSNPQQHDPAEYSTSVSDSWYYLIGASVVLWIAGFGIQDVGPLGTIAGLLPIIAWVLMPLSIYYDRQWVQATTRWKPDKELWMLASVIPLVNIPAGIVYLRRRSNVSRVSTAKNNRSYSSDNTNPAIRELQQRYSEGELSDEEFEQKVERIIGTDDEATAEAYLNQSDN